MFAALVPRWRPAAIAAVLLLFAAARCPAAGEAAPPPPPADLTAQSGGNSEVPLSWTVSPGATSYVVYVSRTQNDTNAHRVPADITGPAFTCHHLQNGATYYFRVKARNAAGESGFSPEVAATTLVLGQPVPDGVYTLAPKSAPQFHLAASGGRVGVEPEAAAATAQRWRLTSVGGATYRLSPVDAPGSALTAAPDGSVAVSAGPGAAGQTWTLALEKGGYRLAPPSAADRALHLAGPDASAPVTAARADGSAAQIWNILTLPDGPDGAPDPGTKYVPPGYKLVFGDEFAAPELDPAKWEARTPYSTKFLNDEIECYEPEGVVLKDGMCVLEAREMPTTCGAAHPWRSGAITSRAVFTRGYYEARIRVPKGQGLWPAFWLTSSKRWPPEWDIMEIPYVGGTLFQYQHPTKASKIDWVEGAEGSDSAFTLAEGMPNPYDGFVIYGCLVTATDVTMWINGRLTAKWAVSGDTSDPMWVSVDLAVGGKWPGPPDATTPQPARMYVDYVRVYQ